MQQRWTTSQTTKDDQLRTEVQGLKELSLGDSSVTQQYLFNKLLTETMSRQTVPNIKRL